MKDQVTIRNCNVRTEDGRVHRHNHSHLSKVPEKYQAMSKLEPNTAIIPYSGGAY